MDVKTKANEIFAKFYSILIDADSEISQEIIIADVSKKCAAKCVDEIIHSINVTTGHLTLRKLEQSEVDDDLRYWQQVKNEIEKLNI